ncbi:DUF5336 domain-containing protein [Mycobacterium aquaticum]|uniref:Uncharacterized protein n=1 Tax=Mycobacterium aquaticum TaxID=1927124 RepID=A0A1X0B1N5_9MYCO|nr:DUF5336 domain-containing protein [Mycobacterium aquaticum]ORA36227.1 hypothetical protein BST13_11770 [Mycobacterium aquaticum]
MAYPGQPMGIGDPITVQPVARDLTAPGVLGVTALAVIGFGMQAGPVYTGRSADVLAAQPIATWSGAGGLALLLAGLLAIPGTKVPAHHYRIIAAVLSAFGFLAVAMGLVVGLLNPPPETGVGWALYVIVVLALAQTVVAVLAVRATKTLPEQPSYPDPGLHEQHPPAPRDFGEVTTRFGVGGASPRSMSYGQGHQAGQNAPQQHSPQQHAPQQGPPPGYRDHPDFVPPASPAGSGAQPARQAPSHDSPGGWGQTMPVQPDRGQAGGGAGPDPSRNYPRGGEGRLPGL